MPDADILLDVNRIELRDGDVLVTETLSLSGEFSVSDGNGNTVVRIKTSGELEITTPNSSQKLTLTKDGITLFNASGNARIFISSTGSISLIDTDIIMMNSSDIKLDNQYLSDRLDSIEQRLTNGGL